MKAIADIVTQHYRNEKLHIILQNTFNKKIHSKE